MDIRRDLAFDELRCWLLATLAPGAPVGDGAATSADAQTGAATRGEAAGAAPTALKPRGPPTAGSSHALRGKLGYSEG